MDILVTGGAGFIGSNFCEKAVDLGHKVICIDNFNNYYNPLIKERNISKLINEKNFVLYNCDILDLPKLEEVFSKNKIDLVIHLAARAGVRPSIENALLYEAVNVQGTINLLDKCRRYDISKFIFASSSSVYGGNTKIPFSEDDNVDHPISPYAATKKAGELICYTYSYLFKMSIYCYRFFTVYGPRQRPEMAIHKFTRQILKEQKIDVFGDGNSSRDYTYIDDIINVMTGNLENIKGFEIINLGNSKPVRLSELISIIEKITNKKALLNYSGYQQGDVFKTCADILKAKKMLKYSPETDIEGGIRKFVAWYMETGKQNKLFED
ncbi:MAG: NAD-dependent epimerase/dehydratase family protein [Actinobacteria bacterium]|nr:NAD-dependent epimerase/dehydratase family protein [Actinomycetota bacterium]